MKKIFFAGVLFLSAFTYAQKKVNPSNFANTITSEDLKKHLYIIAGKEMEGRETATEGQRKAAAYIENHFKQLGLLPGNKGDYQMYYNVYTDSLIRCGIEINGQRFEFDKDFSTNVSSNVPATYRFSEIVFVNLGRSDSLNDDYGTTDVKGKAVIMFGNVAPKSGIRGVSTFTKIEAARKKGAAAILFINNISQNPTARKGNMYLQGFKRSILPQQFYISEKIAQAIMGQSYDSAHNNSIAAKTFSANILLDFDKQMITAQSSNVLGLLEGNDLKDEYVFITAHYDHLGKRGDTIIYYGADDDGSGTVSILEIAEAFANAKKAGKGPRRSIVFMTVSGEEKGLWGSAYYGEHPVYPLEKTTVDLNIDMIGRIDPKRLKGDSTNYVYVVGDDKLSSDLRPISEAVNKKYSKLELDYKYNDPKDQERIYFRSDHYNFAKNGVPIIFYFNGTHRDYHRPTDTPDKINYNLMEKRAQFVFYTAWEMANRNDLLKRDIPLDAASVRR
jgi:hypothetical protein